MLKKVDLIENIIFATNIKFKLYQIDNVMKFEKNNSKAINFLVDNIKHSNLNKSSHWNEYLSDNSSYLNQFESFGFGTFKKKHLIKDIIYNILRKIVFGKKIFKTNTYYKYKSIFNKIDRYIDVDTTRHIFTYEKIKQYLKPKRICIIGDGKINGVLGAHLTFPLAKIYSVNLSEVLINDLIILDRLSIDIKNSIEVVDNKNFISDEKSLTIVPSNFKSFLKNKNIDLFINIASFQEMNEKEINDYFEIIKSNKSKLYCCNREYKKLSGGEELYFEKYPFSGSKRIFWEDCPWYQKFYSIKPPFIHRYNDNIKHCLVDFS